MAHILKRNHTIMITHDPFDDSPFDIKHIRIIKYEDTIKGQSEYEEKLRKTLQSITSGIPEVNHGEFEVISDVVAASNEPFGLFLILALPKTSAPIHEGDSITIEAALPRGKPKGAVGAVDEFVCPLAARKLVELVGGRFSLTDKGQAFVDYLSKRGYEVHSLNERYSRQAMNRYGIR